MRRSLLQLQADLATIGGELTAANEAVQALAMNGAASMDEIKAAKAKRDDVQERFDIVKQAHDEAQAEAQAALADQRAHESQNSGDAIIKAKAAFYRAMLCNHGNIAAGIRELAPDVLNALQANPTGGGTGGENFLPTTLVSELISEPLVTNPIRDIIEVTNVKGLEMSKIGFELDGDEDDDVGDAATAEELEATGDKVSFGRFKSKVICRISDSVYHGSDLDLVTEVENNLRAGLAAREKKVSFTSSPKTGKEHMSFYQVDGDGDSVIKEVSGDSTFEAVTNAIADLHEDYRENATVVMAYADYVAMVRDESALRGDTGLFSAPPEQVIGKPVKFCDAATTPIVGDFRYCRLNYDGDPIYDTDKDVEAGEYLFVLTAWMDQQRKLSSAFRLAVVSES